MNHYEALKTARTKLTAFHLHKTPLAFTHAELDALADDSIRDMKASAEKQGYREDDADESRFTCHACVHAPQCEYVYDPYNTDGDCIADK